MSFIRPSVTRLWYLFNIQHGTDCLSSVYLFLDYDICLINNMGHTSFNRPSVSRLWYPFNKQHGTHRPSFVRCGNTKWGLSSTSSSRGRTRMIFIFIFNLKWFPNLKVFQHLIKIKVDLYFILLSKKSWMYLLPPDSYINTER